LHGSRPHLYTLDGHQQINGVNAIKLTMKPVPGLSVRQTLWVDPSTYLPLPGFGLAP
jgi:hypothetical protein